MHDNLARCLSCDGFGWHEDDAHGAAEDCDWCGGVGYVYRDRTGQDRAIPRADFEAVADALERLEAERLHEMGYAGEAKKPWRQAVRVNTKLGRDPYAEE